MTAYPQPRTDLEQAYNLLQILRSPAISSTSASLDSALTELYIEAQLFDERDAALSITPTTYVWARMLQHMVDLDLTKEQLLSVRQYLYTLADTQQDLLSPDLLKQLGQEKFSHEELIQIKKILAQVNHDPALRMEAGFTKLENLLFLSFYCKAIISLRLLPNNKIELYSNRLPENTHSLISGFIQIPITGFLLALLAKEEQDLFVLTSNILSSAEIAVIENMRASYINEFNIKKKNTKNSTSFLIESIQRGNATEALFKSINNSIFHAIHENVTWSKNHDHTIYYEHRQKRRIVD